VFRRKDLFFTTYIKKQCIRPLKSVYSLFALTFKGAKNYRKKSKIAKNNRKQTAIISHQKFLIIAKKSNPLVQIIIASHLV